MFFNYLELKNVPFSRLLKQELPTLANEVIKTVEKYNPEELGITVGYNRLLALKPTFKQITQPYGPHPITTRLTPAREKCKLYARYIVYKTGMVMKENKYQLTPGMIKSNILVNRYLHRLDLCKRESQVYKQIEDFLIEVKADTLVKELFIEVSMMADVENLELALTDVSSLLMERKSSLAARPKKTTKELSIPIVNALKYFFKEIEVAVGESLVAEVDPEVESDIAESLELLVNDLNETITTLRNSVNLRYLTNKRKAEGLEIEGSGDELIEGEEEEQSTVLMRSVRMDDSSEDSVDEQLDEKKTVATSLKQMQLPALNKEG